MTARIPLTHDMNNPGAIRFNPANAWKGSDPKPGRAGFVRFHHPKWGFRAIARLMLAYSQQGRDTVREIIMRWAPPKGEANGVSYINSTAAYIRSVADVVGVAPDAPIRLDDWQVARKLLAAIAEYEDGAPRRYWREQDILEGLRLAGWDVPPAPLAQRPEAKAAAGGVAGGAVAAGGLGAVLAAAGEHVAPVVATLGHLDWKVAAMVVGVAGVALLAFLVLRARRQDAAS
jgi:hypothetical protein